MVQEAKELDNAERLAVVETELKQLNKTINAMNDKLDVWNQSYVPRNEIDLKFDAANKRIEEVEKKMTVDEQNKWSVRKLWPAWLGLAVAVISLIKDIF